MRSIRKLVATLIATTALPVVAHAAIIGGSYYAIQYDWAEFYAAADKHDFRIELVGNPFPNMDPNEVARRLLPVMQAAKPPVNTTFTYDTPAERQHPDYRLVLIFDPAADNSSAVCAGTKRSVPKANPGRVYVWGVYCRNDQALSEATGWAHASAPEDADMRDLFKNLFDTVFDRSSYGYRQHGHALHH
jgi:hypothetical protein